MNTSPIACTLTADQQRCHADELLPRLGTRAVRREWVTRGVRLSFAPTPENFDAIAQTVARERQCCAFLEFRLDVPAAQGEFSLLILGPDGTREFLVGLGVEASAGADGGLR